MKTRLVIVIVIVLALSMISLGLDIAFAEGNSNIEGSEAGEVSTQSEVQLWGQVISVDPVYNQITVKPVYSQDNAKKRLILTVNQDTSYENASSLSQIGPNDYLSVEYIATANGGYLAKYIYRQKADTGANWNLIPEGEAPASSMPEAEVIE